MRFLFKYATRQRPKWFMETLDKWHKLLSGKHDYLFVVSIDQDDTTMNNQEMMDYCKSKQNVEVCIGNSKTKIQAINADMDGRDFDILVVVSDDMTPQVRGYDDIMARDMQTNFPDLDGALHYNDGQHGRDVLITLSVMGKKLYDRFGYIYHPSYMSVYCDDEFTDIVRIWKKVVYIDKIIVRHEWKKYGSDTLYRRNDQFYNNGVDKKTYEERKKNNFTSEVINAVS